MGQDDQDDDDDNIDVDDAASSASTLPIAQACPNTLSVALRQLNNSTGGDTLSIGSDSKSRTSAKSQRSQQSKKDKGTIMRYVQSATPKLHPIYIRYVAKKSTHEKYAFMKKSTIFTQ